MAAPPQSEAEANIQVSGCSNCGRASTPFARLKSFLTLTLVSLLQIWKIKKLIKSLDSARGAGTSMISLIMPPKVREKNGEKSMLFWMGF